VLVVRIGSESFIFLDRPNSVTGEVIEGSTERRAAIFVEACRRKGIEAKGPFDEHGLRDLSDA
jgi:hypothetical protein